MMPEQNRFFRFLWRFNAILLAAVGILLIAMIVSSGIERWMRPNYGDIPEGRFRPVPKSAEQNDTYRLIIQPEMVSLPHEQMFALQKWNQSPASYGLADLRGDVIRGSFAGLYHYNDAVNVLAVNTTSGTSHWLFNGYSRVVVDQRAIYSGGPPKEEPPTSETPIALVIRTVDADTNHDGTLDFKDRQSLYIYRSGDQRAVKFFEADYILALQQTDNGDFFVAYENGTSATAATFSIPDFKLKSKMQLPTVPP